jgi:hypothetical protein
MLLLILFLITTVFAKCDLKSCQKPTPVYCFPNTLIYDTECTCPPFTTKLTNYNGTFTCFTGTFTCNSTSLKYCCDEDYAINIHFAFFSNAPGYVVPNSGTHTNSCIPIIEPDYDYQYNCSDPVIIETDFQGYNGSVCVNNPNLQESYIQNYSLGPCAATNAGYYVEYFGTCCPDGQQQLSTLINPTFPIVFDNITLNTTCQYSYPFVVDYTIPENELMTCDSNQYTFQNGVTFTCKNLCTKGSNVVKDDSFRGYHCDCFQDLSCGCKNNKCQPSCYTDGYNYEQNSLPPCDCNYTKLFDGDCPESCQTCNITENLRTHVCNYTFELCYGIENHFCDNEHIPVDYTCNDVETWSYLGSDGQIHTYTTRQFNFIKCEDSKVFDKHGHICNNCNFVWPPVNVSCVNEVLNGECIASLYQVCGSCTYPYDPNSLRLCCPGDTNSFIFESALDTYQDSNKNCCTFENVDGNGMCCFTGNIVDEICCPMGYIVVDKTCVLA